MDHPADRSVTAGQVRFSEALGFEGEYLVSC